MFTIQDFQPKNRQNTSEFNIDQQADQLNRNTVTIINNKEIEKFIKAEITRLRFARRLVLIQKKNRLQAVAAKTLEAIIVESLFASQKSANAFIVINFVDMQLNFDFANEPSTKKNSNKKK